MLAVFLECVDAVLAFGWACEASEASLAAALGTFLWPMTMTARIRVHADLAAGRHVVGVLPSSLHRSAHSHRFLHCFKTQDLAIHGDENLASRQHGEDKLKMPMPRSDFQQHVWVHGCEGKQLCDTNGCQRFNDGQVPMHLRQTTYRWIRQIQNGQR